MKPKDVYFQNLVKISYRFVSFHLFSPKIKLILMPSMIFLYSFLCSAQDGPSLSAGINNVTFTKGKLDAELIAEIIATKKGEIKTELARRFILNNFECGSFAVYNYVSNSLNLLLTETNKEIISKGLLENSAELLMIYGFAEFYLKELSERNKTNSLQPHEIIFLKEMGKWADLKNEETIDKNFGTTLVVERKNDNNYPFMQMQKADDGYRASKGIKISSESNEFLPNIKLLSLFINRHSSYSESSRSCTNIAPIHVYIDMIFEVLKANKRVRDAGFFRNVSDDLNEDKNKLFKMRSVNLNIYNKIIGHSKIGEVVGSDSLIWKSLENRIDRIFTFYRTLSTLSNKIDKDDNLDSLLKVIDNELINFDLVQMNMKKSTIDSFYSLTRDLKSSLDNVTIPLTKSQLPDFTIDEKELIREIRIILDKVSNTNFKDQVAELEYERLLLENKIIPGLSVLNVSTYGSFQEVLKKSEHLAKMIKQRGLLGLKVRIDSKNKEARIIKEDTLFINHFKEYIKIVDIINNLDNVESYDKIFSFIMSIVSTFGDDRTKNVISEIIRSYDTYATINKEKNLIVLDVESMAINLYKRYGESSNTRLGLYFSVGISNQFDFNDSKIDIGEGAVNSKFTFVSEKVGLRWNMFDFNKKYSLSSRSEKPLINNIHSLIYFSGLLYQVEFLNSEDKFTSPLYGLGFGLTFFNGLDLNASYAVPFESSFQDGLWCLSFDIRITEYLSALRRKKG